MKKIKNLDPKTNLGGIKVKTPHGQVGYWAGQWQKGVWLSMNPEGNGQIFPIFVENLNECLNWEVDPVEDVNLG